MSVPDFVHLGGWVYDENRQKKKFKHLDKDIRVSNFDLYVGEGKLLLKEAEINLVYGKKHAIIGRNGIGKTQLLKEICMRQGPFCKIPPWYSIMYLDQEIINDEKTALEVILSSDPERLWLLDEVHRLEGLESLEEVDSLEELEVQEYTLSDIYERLREIDAFTAEGRAKAILKGLQFTDKDFDKPVKDFSGGWRMRVALARILFVTPDLAILDEPTNHLDLHATIWLEQYLMNYKKTLLIVSHDENILNECVNTIIHFFDYKLNTYKGNYSTFLKTKGQHERTIKNKKRVEKAKNTTQSKNKTAPKKKQERVF